MSNNLSFPLQIVFFLFILLVITNEGAHPTVYFEILLTLFCLPQWLSFQCRLFLLAPTIPGLWTTLRTCISDEFKSSGTCITSIARSFFTSVSLLCWSLDCWVPPLYGYTSHFHLGIFHACLAMVAVFMVYLLALPKTGQFECYENRCVWIRDVTLQNRYILESMRAFHPAPLGVPAELRTILTVTSLPCMILLWWWSTLLSLLLLGLFATWRSLRAEEHFHPLLMWFSAPTPCLFQVLICFLHKGRLLISSFSVSFVLHFSVSLSNSADTWCETLCDLVFEKLTRSCVSSLPCSARMGNSLWSSVFACVRYQLQQQSWVYDIFSTGEAKLEGKHTSK